MAVLLVTKNIRSTFDIEFTNSGKNMFEFQQYLGFILFLTILTIGFWLMIFLVGFVQYWIGGAIMELVKEKRAKRKEQAI